MEEKLLENGKCNASISCLLQLTIELLLQAFFICIHACICTHVLCCNFPQPPLPTTGDIPLQSGVLPTKQQLVTALIQHIDALLKDWSTHTLSDMTELCTHNHRQFLELKVCK